MYCNFTCIHGEPNHVLLLFGRPGARPDSKTQLCREPGMFQQLFGSVWNRQPDSSVCGAVCIVCQLPLRARPGIADSGAAVHGIGCCLLAYADDVGWADWRSTGVLRGWTDTGGRTGRQLLRVPGRLDSESGRDKLGTLEIHAHSDAECGGDSSEAPVGHPDVHGRPLSNHTHRPHSIG